MNAVCKVLCLPVICVLLLCASGGPSRIESDRGSASFVAGTMVWTRAGLARVEKVTVGTEVFSADAASGKWSYQPVLDVTRHDYSGGIIAIDTGARLLRATQEHPFLIRFDAKSDFRPHLKVTPLSAWVEAGFLKQHDVLLIPDGGEADVKDVVRTSESVPVYDLVTAGNHTFAVSEEGILASDATVAITALSSGGGGGCFPAGTPVWTRDGTVSIERVTPGTLVRTYDPLSETWAYRPVLSVESRSFAGAMLHVDLGDSDFEVTWNHPIWVQASETAELRPVPREVGFSDRASTVHGAWLSAGDLENGDSLLSASGATLTIRRIERRYAETTVYNLRVAGVHTYAVGQAGVIVHNKGSAERPAGSTPASESPAASVSPRTPQVLAVPPGNTEEYRKVEEQPLLGTMDNPLSTFSIDVDTASYSNVRRFLQAGQLPPKDAVRIEEFINYFTYDYPQPPPGRPFAFFVEQSPCPWNPEHLLVHIGLQGRRVAKEILPPSNIVFLIDVSGSMGSPEKLPLLKEALALMVNEMRGVDRIAIVVYAGSAGLVLPPTSGEDKQTILTSLNRLESGGSTAGGAGIQLAYATAQSTFMENGNNRVILATDGDFNVGPSSQGELVRMIEAKRKSGIYLSVLGFGTGNYKDDRMESIADAGNGNYAYIDTLKEARKALGTQLAGTLFTIANDVKIQIEFNPTFVEQYRLIGYENRTLRAEDFGDDTRDAGDMGAGHSVTAQYELVMRTDAGPAQRSLRYQSSQTLPADATTGNELLFIKFRYKNPGENRSVLIEQPVAYGPVPIEEASRNLRFAAAVSSFALTLRNSTYRGKADYDLALRLAEQSFVPDPEGYRREFLGLVKTAQWIDW